MRIKRYPDQVKFAAVKQVTDAGRSIADVVSRLGTTTHSLYAWVKKYGPDSTKCQQEANEAAEIKRLKKELKPGARVPGPSKTSDDWLIHLRKIRSGGGNCHAK